MEEKEIQFLYDTDTIEIKRTLIQFTTPVYESSKELLSNVAFDEISNQPNCLQCVLTDLKLCSKAGNSDKVCFKLDAGASGNLLPLKNYLDLFPKKSVKNLSNTVDPNVHLLTANKSVIKQLGTVRLRVTHSNHTHTCLFYVISSKCHPILGLPDLMQLGLLSFYCRISEDWEGTSDLQHYYKDNYKKFCFDSCEEQWGTALDKDKLINGLTLVVSFQVLVDFQFSLLTSSSQRMLFLYKNHPTCTSFT